MISQAIVILQNKKQTTFQNKRHKPETLNLKRPLEQNNYSAIWIFWLIAAKIKL